MVIEGYCRGRAHLRPVPRSFGPGSSRPGSVGLGGTHGGVEVGGHSRVVDPWGHVVTEADDAEGVTVVDIDPDLVAQTRSEFPVLSDRLADYTALITRKATS